MVRLIIKWVGINISIGFGIFFFEIVLALVLTMTLVVVRLVRLIKMVGQTVKNGETDMTDRWTEEQA